MIVSNHRALSASLAEAESRFWRWENEARGSVERMARVEAERDVARHDALMTRMDADAVRNVRARVESELARVKNALAAVKEARRKADDEVSRMTNERVSLLLELGICKDEISAIRAEALRENESLREAWTWSLTMGMATMLSHITFVVATPKFQMGCRTRPSRYLQSFFY